MDVCLSGVVALMKLWHQGPPEALPRSWNSDVPDVLTSAVDAWAARSHGTGTATPLGRGSGFGVPGFINCLGTLALQVWYNSCLCVCRVSCLDLDAVSWNQKIKFHDRSKFLDGQYHRLPTGSPTSAPVVPPRREQLIETCQGMLSLLTTLISVNVSRPLAFCHC